VQLPTKERNVLFSAISGPAASLFHLGDVARQDAGISIAQLHGHGSRAGLLDIPSTLQVIYVMHVTQARARHLGAAVCVSLSGACPREPLLCCFAQDGAMQTQTPAVLAASAGRTLDGCASLLRV
jgi:hypothetical protein